DAEVHRELRHAGAEMPSAGAAVMVGARQRPCSVAVARRPRAEAKAAIGRTRLWQRSARELALSDDKPKAAALVRMGGERDERRGPRGERKACAHATHRVGGEPSVRAQLWRFVEPAQREVVLA